MLSSQTKDEVTDAAITKLREAVGGTLSIDALLQTSDSAISEAICKVGFWRRKTQYVLGLEPSLYRFAEAECLGTSGRLRRSSRTSSGVTSQRRRTNCVRCPV